MQRLKLPIDNFKPTAGYKNSSYVKKWGFAHYGIDIVSSSKKKTLYALGNGIVKAAGLDGLNGKTTGTGSGCGFVLIIVYENCENNKTHKANDLTVTYMHMESKPLVRVGQKVTTNTLLGYYGNTGAKTSGPHLHFQMDTDTKFFDWCSGVSKDGHNLLKKGVVDSTVNPVDYLWIGEGQKITAPTSIWYDANQFLKIPNMNNKENDAPKYKNLITKGGPIILGGD